MWIQSFWFPGTSGKRNTNLKQILTFLETTKLSAEQNSMALHP